MKKIPQSVLYLRHSILVLLLFAGRTNATAETWALDPTFQRTPLLVTSEAATGVNVLQSGKVLIHSVNGYPLSGANGQRIGALIRVDGNTGAIDPTWHPDPAVTARGYLGVAEAPDGKIYYSTQIAGEAANSTDPYICRVVRLNTDGSRDTSFNSPVFSFLARFMAVQPDGKIIVCYGGTNTNGVVPASSITLTARLNTDGTLDSTFQSPIFQSSASGGDNGSLFGSPLIDPATGKIYFCGSFRFVNGQARRGIARCNPDGTLDTSFVPTGTTSTTGRAMVLQAGGKVVLGGTTLRTTAGGTTNYALLRFLSDGTLDPAFTLVPVSSALSGQTRYVGALPDGKLVSTSDTQLVRYLADGALDSSFASLTLSSPSTVPGLGSSGALRFDINLNTGAIYLRTNFPRYANINGTPVPGNITKISSDGVIDGLFVSAAVNSEDFAPNIRLGTGGAIYLSGAHTDFGGTANASIARLRADGTRDPGYALETLPFQDKQALSLALLPDGAAYVSYYSGAFNGYSFSNLVRLTPTGALDPSFRLSPALQDLLDIAAFDGNESNLKFSTPALSAGPGGSVYAFSSRFGFGTNQSQNTVNTNGNLKIVRINPDGTEDTSVPPLGFPLGEVVRDSSSNQITEGSTGYLQRLAETPDGGFIVLASVAPFPTSTGAPYNFRILKLRADGSPDASVSLPTVTSTESPILDFPQFSDPVTMQIQQPPNGFYIAGTSPVANAVPLSDGSVVVAGKFRVGGDPTIFSLAKFKSNGALDTSFTSLNPSNTAQPSRAGVVTKVRAAPDGKLWVLGRFDTFGGSPAPGVARLNSNGTLDTTFAITGVEYYDSFDDRTDIVFTRDSTAYLVGTFRKPGEPVPFAVTRIIGPPIIISPLNATGTLDQQFTYQFLVQGATSLTVTGLPPGLTFNPTLKSIVGTPTQLGTFMVGLTASNSVGTTNTTLTLTVQAAPGSGPVISSSTAATGRTGSRFRFQVFTSGGTNAARLSAVNLPPGLTLDAVTGVISGTPSTEGSFAVVLTVTDGNFTATSVLQITVTADLTVPVIISPSQATISPGQSFSYAISAPALVDPSDVTTYTLIGNLPNGLFFDATTGVISGSFTGNLLSNRTPSPSRITLSGGIVGNVQLFGTNSHGTSTIPLNFFLAPVGAVNIATRLVVGTGNDVLIAGFIITGNAPKQVILRAMGPSLPIPGVLQDPVLELHEGASLLGLNDNWKDSQENEIIATTIPPTDGRESAIMATLAPGNYTAVVSGRDNTTGIAVVELYDLGTASLDTSSKAQLAQISTRGTVQGGDSVMIGGFIISGQASKVIVRAIGPSLNGILPGALQDPLLELHDGSGALISANDDWKSTQEQQIIDTTVPPTDDRESAIVATLAPGNYTAVVRGKDDTTGVALVEVYGLQ